jgi:hypothetical protein
VAKSSAGVSDVRSLSLAYFEVALVGAPVGFIVMPLRHLILSWRTLSYCLCAAIVIVICFPFAYVANEYRLKAKYERALDRIEVGDTEQSVVGLMGQPDERNCCYPLPTDHDSSEEKRFHADCVQTYTYVTFMENYGVTLNKDNRVSGKFTSVSP